MTTFLDFLAQAQGAAPAAGQASSGGSLLGNPMIMMILLIVMFYFLLIRPQQRQRKELQKRIESMATGDRVVTSSGIHAIVHHIKEHTVTLKVAEGTMIEFDKQAIAAVHKKEGSYEK